MALFLGTPATIEAGASSSALKTVADSLSAGQWGEVTGHTGSSILHDGFTGDAESVFEFADRALWDPQTKRWLFYGSSDPANSRGLCSYDEATNAFQREAFPNWSYGAEDDGAPPIEHSYNCNVIALERREIAYHQMGSGDTSFNTHDLDTAFTASSWSSPDGLNSDGNSAISIDWFPTRGRYVVHTGVEIREYDPALNSWSGPIAIRDHGNQCGAEYCDIQIAGQTGRGCVVVYGSAGGFDMFLPDGTITALDNYPGSGAPDSDTAFVTRDPASGKLICFVCVQGTNTHNIYELDPSKSTTNQWTRLNSVEGAGPFRTGHYEHPTFAASSAVCHSHGVIMIVQVRGTGVEIWLYKHTDSVTMDELIADSESWTLANAIDTTTALDFMTLDHGAASQETIHAGQGNGVQLNDTTDPSRFLRDHVNGANWIDTNPTPDVLYTSTLAMQDSEYTPWVAQWSTLDESAGGSVAKGPQIVSGVGEFENLLSATQSCLRLRTPGLCTQKASGDFVIPFRRQEGIGASGPYSFLTAGTGAEFWIRYAIKHDATFLSTTQDTTAGTAEAKRSIISGDSSSQTLEETCQEVNANRTWAMYSNSGSEPYTESNHDYVEEWTVVHIQVIVANPQTTSNGVVRLYLNDDDTPIVEETAAEMNPGGSTLRSGWGFENTSSEDPNQGYWKLWLTNFVTSKDPAQSHADLDCWYDNVVIRQDTRCPHIRTG